MTAPLTESGTPATKTEIRTWLARIRLDCRDIADVLADGDWSNIEQWALDITGAAAKIAEIAQTRMETQS